MKRRPKQVTKAKTAAEVMPPLDEDNPLAAIAGHISPQQYARVSAREFAIGKYSTRKRKRRYALT